MLYRASSSAAPATPSKTPVSVTQSLSNLRLAHARLMEEHGSNVALLRHREQELSELQERTVETIGRTNRHINAWPADDTEGYETVKSKCKLLMSCFKELQALGQEDMKLVYVYFSCGLISEFFAQGH